MQNPMHYFYLSFVSLEFWGWPSDYDQGFWLCTLGSLLQSSGDPREGQVSKTCKQAPYTLYYISHPQTLCNLHKLMKILNVLETQRKEESLSRT